jgi:hypothetical protein
VAQEPAFRPDYAEEVTLPSAEQLAPDDWLLNSLCQFDLWWCIVAAANVEERKGNGGVFYPSCAALHQYRAQPALETIATNKEARSEAFPKLPNSTIATAVAVVVGAAVRESHNYGGWWEGLEADARVEQFVTANATVDVIFDF